MSKLYSWSDWQKWQELYFWEDCFAVIAFLRSVKITTVSAAGIKNVQTIEVNEKVPIYNLAGQRVGKDYKGVVIQNGKKFIKK